jgi:tetratricopeptide (TPR) repeat protein
MAQQGYTGPMPIAEGQGVLISSLLETAERHRRAGRLAEARVLFMEAAHAADAAGDNPSFVSAALGCGGIWVNEQRDRVSLAVVQSIWQRADELTIPGSTEAARLAVRRAAEATYEGEPVEVVLDAVEHIRSLGDDFATAEALSLLHHTQLGPRDAAARLGVAEELLTAAARVGDALLTLMGLCWRTVDLFLLGDPRASQSLQELRERSTAERCEAIIFIAEVLSAMTIARAGRFEEAEAAAAHAANRGVAVGDPDAPAYLGAVLTALRWWQGRGAEIIDAVRGMAISPRLGLNDHVYVAADAALSAATGDLDAAEEALARLNGIGLDRLPYSSTWLSTQFSVAEAAYVLGDAQSAASVVELMAPFTHLPVMPSLASVCFGSAERAVGLSAAAMGQADAAVHHLEAAIREDRRLGNRPMAVSTEHELAAILRARGRHGDVTRSDALARHAAERAKGLGMVLPETPAWLQGGELRDRHVRTFHEASLQRLAGGWRISVDGRATLIADQVGLHYLADLVARPRQDCHVLDLATSGLLRGHIADEVADQRAIAEYRRRAKELTELIHDADLSMESAERYEEELGELATAVADAVGLGGRMRHFANNDERARTAVRKALMRAVNRIDAVEPELGQHLRSSLETGISCRYSPISGWRLRVEGISD